MSWMKWTAVLAAVALAGAATTLYVSFGAFLPWREDAEAERLVATLGLTPGTHVAEIGAGAGRFTVALARAVGAGGRVYSTELNSARREAIAARTAAAGLSNVTVLEGAPAATNLPDACCAAIVMRSVYHHLADPAAFTASLARALSPRGLVAIIDFDPGMLWFHRTVPHGSRRSGHGVTRVEAIAELTAAGFVVRQDVPDWSGPLWLVIVGRDPLK
jgi:ubiquinone/menaquinone biosynthesis C-methylase UbiE